MMRRSGLGTKIGEDHVYHTIDEAIRSLVGARTSEAEQA